MSAYTTVFEFDFLCFNKEVAKTRGYAYIPKSDFDYLSNKVSQDEQSNLSNALKWQRKQGTEIIQVQNYAGVIFVPSGQHVEVLPKTGKASVSVEETRKIFLTMLRTLGDFKHIQWENVDIDSQKIPLLEVFIRQFLESVSHVVKRSLRSEYVTREDNLLFKKGKLSAPGQLRHNLVLKHRFYCEFDEYLKDRAENRLLKAALLKVGGYCKSHHNQKLTNELLFGFDSVPESKSFSNDLQRVRLTRGMDYYTSALEWTKLILNGLSPTSVKGGQNAPSLLFPMEQVFESFVASKLRQQLSPGCHLVTQSQSMNLVKHVTAERSMGKFNLRPDLIIEQDGKRKVVLDTKWKLLNPVAPENKYGLSQQDFYQMYAYGQKYLNGKGTLILIYPATDCFSEPLEGHFVFDGELKLWVLPYVIKANGEGGLSTPEELRNHSSFVAERSGG
ncbi:McrC family protein [Photobacterium leiognathi]|uniref:McrC family protein n=1 Tax=Photobacterium leiognathi TaxID=553611 RepID=UPI002980B1DC|nr:McrC family protein [Photobacterium leiognathi]